MVPIFQFSNVRRPRPSIPQAAGLSHTHTLNSLPTHQTQLSKKPHARILIDPIFLNLSLFFCADSPRLRAMKDVKKKRKENAIAFNDFFFHKHIT
jgi:hypothetical protein